MQDLYVSIGSGKFFTVLDLEAEYHQPKIKDSDMYKTAFITKSGTYEYIWMSFGLINASYTFQKLINSVLKSFINKFYAVCSDEVMIHIYKRITLTTRRIEYIEV